MPFDDYDADELCEITKLMAKKNSIEIDSEALNKLYGIYEQACRQPEFGNGRFVRNILEQARMRQMLRLVKMDVEKVTKKDLTRLVAEDFEVPSTPRYKEKAYRVIGF